MGTEFDYDDQGGAAMRSLSPQLILHSLATTITVTINILDVPRTSRRTSPREAVAVSGSAEASATLRPSNCGCWLHMQCHWARTRRVASWSLEGEQTPVTFAISSGDVLSVPHFAQLREPRQTQNTDNAVRGDDKSQCRRRNLTATLECDRLT